MEVLEFKTLRGQLKHKWIRRRSFIKQEVKEIIEIDELGGWVVNVFVFVRDK